MPDASQDTAIRDAVDRGFDDQIAFTADLVRYPSVRGAEHTAQDCMARAMRERGLDIDRWIIDLDDIKGLKGYSPVNVSYENALNVVGIHRPRAKKGRSLVLNGHIDVVPEGPLDMWTTPPYEPKVADGWLYGRGSGDMKAGLVACVFALEALRRAGWQPAAEVFVQSVIEEECTGNGALACVGRGYVADAALIPEPRGESVLSAQIGVMWFQVRLKGRPVHASVAGEGANAIEAAGPIIRALHAMKDRWNGGRAAHPPFDTVANPININIGKITGGDWASSVPAWCDIDVRIATYPGQDLGDARREIEDTIRQSAQGIPFLANNPPEVLWFGFQAEGYILPEGSDAERTLGGAHQRVFGQKLLRTPTTATTDARFFGLYSGMPALVYGPKAASVHGFDERVEIESIRRTTQAMALFIADWCGLEAA
ncbi:ArgE/DapE family deacylase [Stella sp.]|uniref:ArgE/DapE family deacylase n=1 Tax=Stella sp. TaxID=2912054 RepID=UPI0035B4EF08